MEATLFHAQSATSQHSGQGTEKILKKFATLVETVIHNRMCNTCTGNTETENMNVNSFQASNFMYAIVYGKKSFFFLKVGISSMQDLRREVCVSQYRTT